MTDPNPHTHRPASPGVDAIKASGIFITPDLQEMEDSEEIKKLREKLNSPGPHTYTLEDVYAPLRPDLDPSLEELANAERRVNNIYNYMSSGTPRPEDQRDAELDSQIEAAEKKLVTLRMLKLIRQQRKLAAPGHRSWIARLLAGFKPN